jgi:hypothetical protein
MPTLSFQCVGYENDISILASWFINDLKQIVENNFHVNIDQEAGQMSEVHTRSSLS